MITEDLVKKSLDLMASSPANYEYFFIRLTTPDWIEPLWKGGRFKDPPAARRQEGTISFPPWPESQYLVRMAGEAPEAVKKVILSVPETDNQRVHQDFVEAALKMPGPPAAEIAIQEAAWIREQKFLYVLYPDRVSELIAHLADQGHVTAALKLARALIRLSPDPRPRTQIGEGDDVLEMPADAVAKFDDWHYQQSLRKITKPLVTADEEGGLELLCDVLEFSLKAHVRPGPSETEGEDYSWIWRPQIGVDGHDEVKDSLVSAVRDAAVLLATSDPHKISPILGRLIARRWRVFRRIAAFVLITIPNPDPDIIKEFLLSSNELQDYPATVPELATLLTRSFSNFPEEIQRRFLTNIDTGPKLDTYEKNFEASQKRPPNDADLQNIADRWRLQWLEPIHEALPTDIWQNRYKELVERFGQPSEIRQPRGVFVGPTSPKTSQELQQLEPEKLIEYLKTWVPSNEWASHTPAGLGRELTSLLSVGPEKLSQLADKLIDLDATYISSAIEGFSEAVKKGLVIDWARVSNLCEWVVKQGVEIPNRKISLIDGDPDWTASRIAVARLLTEGLRNKTDAQLPKEFRAMVWGLLTSLVNGPDPTAARVQKYAENSFPGTISLNTPRGIALDAVIDYAFWIHPYDPKKVTESAFSEAPEVRDLLDTLLRTDSSLATGEVLGRRFPALFMLDRSWVKDNVELIFKPQGKQLERVAWINYLLFCEPYDELLPILQSQYERAIDSLAQPLDSSVKSQFERNLVAHLISFFWRGRLNWDDKQGSMARFFETAPIEMRAYAFEVIGRRLGSAPGSVPLKEGDSQNLLERLRKLLGDRLNTIKQTGKEACELEPFGWWFISNQFDPDWLMENLLAVLRVCHKISPDWLVVECLAKDVKSRPVQSVEALEKIILGDREGWQIHGWEQHARELLKNALDSDSAEARESAIRVINLIGSRGHYGFRDLLRTEKTA